MSIQQHPDYHQGFYDAQDGEPLFDDCPSAEYRAGWEAFHECKALAAQPSPQATASTPEGGK